MASLYLRCSGCKETVSCSQFSAAFASTTVHVLLALQDPNYLLETPVGSGSAVLSASPGIVVGATEHLGQGLYEFRAQRQDGVEMLELESGVGVSVHQFKGTRRRVLAKRGPR